MSQISYSINRSRNGILFTVETVPQIEAFFGDEGTEVTAVNLYGRLWTPLSGGELSVYPLAEGLKGSVLRGMTRENIRLDRPGLALIDDPALGGPSINLSVLRLVGISNPGGVSFRYEGVFTKGVLSDMLRRFQEASSAFYSELLTPVRLTGRIMKED